MKKYDKVKFIEKRSLKDKEFIIIDYYTTQLMKIKGGLPPV